MNISQSYPELSVIIPVFNDAGNLLRCLHALSLQINGTPSFEVVVVDNASHPALEIHEEYLFPLKIVYEPTPGSYSARNTGVTASRGKILAFTDADCVPASDWLYLGYLKICAGNHGLILGGEVVFQIEENPSSVAMYQYLTGFGQQTNVTEKKFSATANLFCTRIQFNKTGLFEQRLLSGGDREWCWRALLQGGHMMYAPDLIVTTRVRSTLRSAFRQARRVAAGRRTLRELGLTHIGSSALNKQRSPIQAILWIISNKDISIFNRLKVLCIAFLIRAVVFWETVRLALGAKPERL